MVLTYFKKNQRKNGVSWHMKTHKIQISMPIKFLWTRPPSFVRQCLWPWACCPGRVRQRRHRGLQSWSLARVLYRRTSTASSVLSPDWECWGREVLLLQSLARSPGFGFHEWVSEWGNEWVITPKPWVQRCLSLSYFWSNDWAQFIKFENLFPNVFELIFMAF